MVLVVSIELVYSNEKDTLKNNIHGTKEKRIQCDIKENNNKCSKLPTVFC